MPKEIQRPNTLEELIDILEIESRRRRKADRILRLSISLLLAACFGAILIVWVRRGTFPDDMASSFASFAGLGGIGAAVSARHKQALNMASQFQDLRLVPYLIEATTIIQSKVPELAREILIVQLPLLHGQDDLPEESRKLLAASLLTTKNPKYLRAVLDALEVVAGSESISSLKSFLKRPLGTRIKDAVKLKDRTRIVLGSARIRAAQKVIRAKEEETANILGQSLVTSHGTGASSQSEHSQIPGVSERPKAVVSLEPLAP